MNRFVVASVALVACVLVLPGCGTKDWISKTDPILASAGTSHQEVLDRVGDIESAVQLWGAADTIADARAAAEQALNLVVGSGGPDYGDADGDGAISGETVEGLLPGLSGEMGLAQTPPVNSCVLADVLGGSWEDPQARWDEATTAVAEWSSAHNTMPTLASHPQRIFGWASLTFATDDIDEAHEYAGHAQLHVDVTRNAIENCA